MRLYGASSIGIRFNSREFDKAVREAIEAEINEALNKGRQKAENDLKSMVRLEFLGSPETTSMINGKLQAEFGFDSGSSYVVPIIDWIVSRIQVRIKPYRYRSGQNSGGYQVELAVFDLDEICSLGSASYISDVNYVRDIEWLRWLLSAGSKIIIKVFQIEYSFGAGHRSRSGKAIMVRGKGWRVPSEYAGTISNNWITRTFDSLEGRVAQILELNFTKYLK